MNKKLHASSLYGEMESPPKLYIRCAAIKYKLKGEEEFKYMTGYCHADCIGCFSAMDIPARLRDMDNELQGFMTSENKFVDRTEALAIAKAASQIKDSYQYDILYSEFLEWR